MPDSLLLNSLIIFGVAIGLVLVFHRIRVPAIVGFFVTGLLVGPHGFGLIKSGHGMGILGEIGVVLLLFTIGIGLSFETLLRMKNPAFFGGSVQILLSVLMGFLLASRAGLSFGQAMFIGFLISHSSTIIMLRIFQTRGEVETPHARISLGIAIFQDIMTVPMMLLIPVLAGGRVHNGESPFFILGKGIGIILLALAAGRYVVRPLLFQIVRTRSRELFLLTLITVCLAVAGLTSAAGLSLALGAFLAGLIISESEFTHQALGDLSPFRDVFTSFFFISVGMLLNLRVFLDQAFLIFALAVLVLFLKAGVFTLTVMVLKYPLRTGILTGLAMCQIGEFSFV